MMLFFICRLHLALNIRDWPCPHYIGEINSVNQFVFIYLFTYLFLMMKNHTVQSVLETASNFSFFSPLLQAACSESPLEWAKTHSLQWAWGQVLKPQLSWCSVTPKKREGFHDYFWGASVSAVSCRISYGSHVPRCSVFHRSSWPKQMHVANKWFGEADSCCYLKTGVKTVL